MGLRVIVLAHSPSPIVGEKLPAVLKPIAVISIADNIREDAVDTIKWFGENDVNIKVISGDNPVTVCEVAKRAGIKGAEKYRKQIHSIRQSNPRTESRACSLYQSGRKHRCNDGRRRKRYTCA